MGKAEEYNNRTHEQHQEGHPQDENVSDKHPALGKATQWLTEKQPELLLEMRGVMTEDADGTQTSWMKQQAMRVVHQDEGESRHSDRLDPETSAGKLFNEFQEMRHTLNHRDGEITVAKAIMFNLNRPAAEEMQQHMGIDPDSVPQLRLHGDPVRNQIQLLAGNWQEISSAGTDSLDQCNEEAFGYSIDSMKGLMEDIAATAGDQAVSFQAAATEKLDGTRWTDITKPEHREHMYEVMGKLTGEWSSDYRRQVASDLTDSIAEPLYDRMNQHLHDNPRSVEAAETAGNFLQKLAQARTSMSYGMLAQDEPQYRIGDSQLRETEQEIAGYLENGTRPGWMTEPPQSHWADQAGRIQQEAIAHR